MTPDSDPGGASLSLPPVTLRRLAAGEQMLDEVLGGLSRAFDGELVGFQSFDPPKDGYLRVSGFRAIGGDAAFVDRIGTYLMSSPRLRPVSILRRARGPMRFVGLDAVLRTYDERERAQVWEPLCEHTGLRNQMRLMVFDGDALVGWLGVARLVEDELDRRLVARANALLPSLASRLVMAHRAALAANPEVPGDLLVTERGTIEYASASGRRWIDREGCREAIAALVRDRSWHSGDRGDPYLLGASTRIVRLEDERSARYLVQLARSGETRVSAAADLTDTQRKVALEAASGATVAEIAEALGCAEHTVRVHLRTIYGRLGVGNRVELARMLET